MGDGGAETSVELRALGAVFDLDGTLTDNMALHAEAFTVFVARHGLPALTRDTRARLDGKRNRDIFPILFERDLAEDELAAYSEEKESLYRDRSRGKLRPVDGLSELLDALERHGLPVGIATAAPAPNVIHTLGELGLERRLTRVVRAEDVPRGKPHPDVFLAAAALIGVRPEDCLAFEDAPLGVTAARAAGMTCVALTTTFAAHDFARHGAEPQVALRDFAAFLDGPGAWLRGPGDARRS